MKSLILLFFLSGLSSCLLETEEEIQYVYDLKIQSENKEVTIDSVEVKVSANNTTILEKIYPKAEIRNNVVTIIFNAKSTDKINLSYAAYSKDFKVLEYSEEFELEEAQKNSDRVNVVKLDSLLWELVILDTNHAPMFVTIPSDLPSAVVTNTEIRDSLYYEDADGDSVIWTILEGPPWLSLKNGILTINARDNDSGTVNVIIEIQDGKGKSDSLNFSLEIIKPLGRGSLKSSSGWNNNQNGDNIFSFNALPTGYRLNTGEFTGLNQMLSAFAA